MKRFIEDILIKWKDEKGRKPLILSGARQVGKSYVIEQNFARHFEQLLTVNFEKQPEFQSCFESGYDPTRILRRIEALAGQRLTIGKTLLFLDEVQLCSEAIISLRYFFEEMPDLHIIAAGSLLEFAIEKISIPVGRVTFRHMGPNGFFGELALLDSKPRSATVTAVEPTSLFRLAQDDFYALMSEQPGISRSINRALCKIIRDLSA